jgi:hypothetical protein
LYKTPGQHLTLGQVVELNRRFIEGYLHFKDEPQVQKVQADVIRYNRFLKDLGLKDHQVRDAAVTLCCYSIHAIAGSSGKACYVEDTWTFTVSDGFISRVDQFCIAGCDFE